MASDHSDRPAWIDGPASPCFQIPRVPQPAKRLILLGAPGAGKGTQADLLHQRMGACHLSTGDVFRAAAKSDGCAQSPAMQQALGYMRRGELVPDTTVWEMVRERKECLHCRGGFILDGFPRTLAQAEALKRLMDDEQIPLTAVVNYDLPASVIVERLAGRRTCEGCKAVYHVTERPPKADGVCDRCQSKLFQREDDRPESIRVRLEAYQRNTAPLIKYYRDLGILVEINAAGTADEIYSRTISALGVRAIRSA